MRRNIICIIAIFLYGIAILSADTLDIYQKQSRVQAKSQLDNILVKSWNDEQLPIPLEASDTVFLRRAYLNFTGRLPNIQEIKDYLADESFNKSDVLIDKLVESDEFNEFWAMYFEDFLRVKSEFPINLWPNAVYAYSRRIRAFLENNEPYDDFVRALLLGTGSNFREAEANFYRALPRKNSDGISEMVAQTLMGLEFNQMSEFEQEELKKIFNCVKYKWTKEWKEEIVFVEFPTENFTVKLPQSKEYIVKKNEDPREVFANYLLKNDNPYFARALVNRVWYKFFGINFSEDPNNLLSEIHSEYILNYLANYFVNNNYDFKKLCKLIGKSIAFKSSAFAKEQQLKSEKFFSAYKMQRLDAEVIDDMINDITKSKSFYNSVIPEPFTYLDGDARTISINDGSISSSFLIIFGRSVRDSGKVEDRNNSINAKQRQQLFNSSDFYRKMTKLAWGKDIRKMKFNQVERINFYYLTILSRYPTASELEKVLAYIKKSPKNMMNVIWILFNTQEFLYKN